MIAKNMSKQSKMMTRHFPSQAFRKGCRKLSTLVGLELNTATILPSQKLIVNNFFQLNLTNFV